MNKILTQQHGWGSQWLYLAKNMHTKTVHSEWFYLDKILDNKKMPCSDVKQACDCLSWWCRALGKDGRRDYKGH